MPSLANANVVRFKSFILLALISTFFVCLPASPVRPRQKHRNKHVNTTETVLEHASSRVVNGEPVTDKAEYPFVVDLSFHPLAVSSSRFCTATLIADNIILTAAHCVLNNGYKSPVYATIGRIELDDNHAENKKARTFRTIASIVHPQYRGLGSPNDVALMLLNATSNAPKIRLANQTPERGDVAWVVGYGIKLLGTVETSARPVEIMSGRLQKTALRIMNSDFCNSPLANMPTAPGMLCTTGVKTGSSACRGDSGGGLFLRNQRNSGGQGSKKRVEQVGIVSYGDAQCSSKDSGVFTDVSAVKEWIDSSVDRLRHAFGPHEKATTVSRATVMGDPACTNGKVVRLLDEAFSVPKL